jgi:dsDNA-specific endonuclease/ATPase MutS2
MINKTIQTLEFDKIRDRLSDYAYSDNAKQKLQDLKPYISENEVNARIKETSEARKILDSMGFPPLAAMKDIDKLLVLTEAGSMLIPEQLNYIALFITACSRIKNYLKKAETLNVDIAYYGTAIYELAELHKEISQSIRSNTVDDNASKELKDIRRKIEQNKSDIKSKLDSLLRSKKEWFNDSYVSSRNGHYVLPVKKEYKNQISGSVLDISSTGTTYFIEPNSVMKIETEISMLQIAEDNEIRRILYTLTALVGDNSVQIKANMETMEILDFIFAKAKLSSDMKAVAAIINTKRYIHILNGRHPFIDSNSCVPLNFSIGDGIDGVIITGAEALTERHEDR